MSHEYPKSLMQKLSYKMVVFNAQRKIPQILYIPFNLTPILQILLICFSSSEEIKIIKF